MRSPESWARRTMPSKILLSLTRSTQLTGIFMSSTNTGKLSMPRRVDLPFEKPPKYATTHAGGVGRQLSANAPSEASERAGLAHAPCRPSVSMLAARRTSSLTARGSMRILRISPPRSDFVMHAASP